MEKASSNEQENRRRTPTSQYSIQALNKGASQGLKPAASNGENGVVKEGYVPGKANAVLHGVVTPAVRPGSSMSSNTHGTNKRHQLIDGRGAHCTVEPPQRAGRPAATIQLSLLQRLYECLCPLSRGICRCVQHWGGTAILRACLDQCRNRALWVAILARLNIIRAHCDRTILGRWCPTITESQQLRGRRAGFARRASSHGRAVTALVEAVGDGQLDSGVL